MLPSTTSMLYLASRRALAVSIALSLALVVLQPAPANEAPDREHATAKNSLQSLEQLVTAKAADTAPAATNAGDVPAAVLAGELDEGGEPEESDAALEEPSLASVDSWVESLKGGSLRLMLLLGAVSLAPAAFLMTTSYVRIVVVLSLLKQALGNQQALPAQATTALALFMTGLIMTPVWQQVYTEAVLPYQAAEGDMTAMEALRVGVQPVRQFMSRQIDHADNGEDVWLFYRYLPEEQRSNPPQTYDEVPLQVLLPAFLLSELKTAFLIGFQIYLPFLVLDFVIATVITSMGLNTMQPGAVAFPFKLLLFVLVDGWRLVAGTLLESFSAF